jgi:superfamily II DNA/RNA helicase
MKAVLLQMATGLGKTIVFTICAKGVSEKNGRTLILVHRNELLLQACEKLRIAGMEYGVISAAATMDLTRSTQVASVQTIVRRLEKIKAQGWSPTFIIVDEAAHAQKDNTWGKILAAWPDAKILGVTATPVRSDGGGLDDVFDDMVRGPSITWATENGFLSPTEIYCPPSMFDASQVKRRMGDFANDALETAMDKPTIHGDAVAHYARICPHTPAIAFCVSVAHAEHVAEAFRAAGFKSASIDGAMEMSRRRMNIEDLGAGRLDVLTACDVVSEGTDIPVVGAAILLRPTMSEGLFLQQVGRVLRPAQGKVKAILLDHVGNVGRHIRNFGVVNDEFVLTGHDEWSLQGKGKDGGGKREGPPPPVTCTGCYRQIVRPLPPCCPYCKEDLTPIGREEELKQVAGELKKLEEEQVEAMRKNARKEQGGAQTMADLIKLAHSRGMKNPTGWARHVMAGRKEAEVKKEKKAMEAMIEAQKNTDHHVGMEEGDTCNRYGCKGNMVLLPVKNCNCWQSAPCYNCTSNLPTCDQCGEKSTAK